LVDDDWSTKLKKIEREFQGLPPEPSPAFKKLQSEEERRAQERAKQRVAAMGAGARLILVFALFGALAVWPYENACGSGLFGYIFAEAAIVAGGLWVAFTTWRARLPRLHAVSLLVILIGLGLIAAEVLPRNGYARVDPKHPPVFFCPESKAPAPSANPQTTDALPGTDLVGQRVRFAAQSMESRWQESSGELVKQFRPQRAALKRIVHPGLLSKPNP
jgi:hypothetical protein